MSQRKEAKNAELTDRDYEILRTLTQKVRVLTSKQAALAWWGEGTQAQKLAQGRLSVLVREGLLARDELMVHPELVLNRPVVEWRPGDEEPDFGAVAYRLKSRWAATLQPTALFLATKAANRLVGGYIGDRRPRRAEATHDVHLAAVYLWLRSHHPEDALAWDSEHRLYAEGGGRGEKLPDAWIRHAVGVESEDRIVEFGGAYCKRKLEAFHDAFAGHRYDLW